MPLKFSKIVLAVAATVNLVTALPRCKILSTTLTATAENLAPPIDFDVLSILGQNNFTDVVSSFAKEAITGQYNIVSRYCEPEISVASRESVLQILIHGATYTKDYWSGLAPPKTSVNGSVYSWIDYASKLGYPTLSIDRLCNGDSSHPNGLLVCQVPLQAAIVNKIISKARTGSLISDHNFSKVIVVGHSLGSVVSHALVESYPTAADAAIFTGFTSHLLVGSGTAAQEQLAPARIGFPQKFGNLKDPTYLVATSESGMTGLFYHGDYVQRVAEYDFLHRGTAAAGEFLGNVPSQQPARNYKNPVLVLNGQQDLPFCARPSITSPGLFYGDCGTGNLSYSARTRKIFPNARVYKWDQVGPTGHDINCHLTARQAFKIAHKFLATQGF